LGTEAQLLDKNLYIINNKILGETLLEKDLGILINSKLDWDDHIVRVCSSANAIAKTIFKCFQHKSVKIIKKLYTSMIRPRVEYANVAWYPTTARQINMLEKVQRRWTKLGHISHLSYPDRLTKLGLTTLSLRRIRGDLIQMFKYVNGIDKMEFVRPPKFLTRTRGHCYKFVSEHCNHNSRFHFFLNRVSKVWNKLPDAAVQVKSVNAFKNALNDLDLLALAS
jgi:hypothetical protein